jgi:hypothetical protein
LLVSRTLLVVERLPIVVAIRLIGDPGLEIGPLGIRVEKCRQSATLGPNYRLPLRPHLIPS